MVDRLAIVFFTAEEKSEGASNGKVTRTKQDSALGGVKCGVGLANPITYRIDFEPPFRCKQGIVVIYLRHQTIDKITTRNFDRFRPNRYGGSTSSHKSTKPKPLPSFCHNSWGSWTPLPT